MTPYYTDATVNVYAGDCLDVLRELPDASVDAVVTDPPYGLEFMGKEWDAFRPQRDARTAGRAGEGATAGGASVIDHRPSPRGAARVTYGGNRQMTLQCAVCGVRSPIDRKHSSKAPGCQGAWVSVPMYPDAPSPLKPFQDWCQLWATECLRVLKPGGHLLAMGGSRTYHRLTTGVEDAGFEIRDCITWHHGAGFPKSLNVTDALNRLVPADAHCVCGPRSTRTVQGSPVGYPSSHGSDGEPPQTEAVDAPPSAPSPAGAPGHNRDDLPRDGQVEGPPNIGPDEATGHLSNGGSPRPSALLSTTSLASESAQFDTPSSTSPLTDSVSDRTPGHTQDTRDSGDGSASVSSWRDKHMTCPECGGFAAPQGLGTALKPATEFIVVARKPLAGTVAANVLAHGTGALNVDGCRVGMSDSDYDRLSAWAGRYGGTKYADGNTYAKGMGDVQPPHTAGRWPANVCLDESQAAALDQQSGELTSGKAAAGGHVRTKPHATDSMAGTLGGVEAGELYGDTGGASRFFYTAKADAGERVRINGVSHPTVKPLSLMRWLVRLVCPPGGVVLEPFAGSGTTVEACILEGFRCIAIEREHDYLPLIVQRINRRRDPVAAVLSSGEDGGLFDLLGEATA